MAQEGLFGALGTGIGMLAGSAGGPAGIAIGASAGQAIGQGIGSLVAGNRANKSQPPLYDPMMRRLLSDERRRLLSEQMGSYNARARQLVSSQTTGLQDGARRIGGSSSELSTMLMRTGRLGAGTLNQYLGSLGPMSLQRSQFINELAGNISQRALDIQMYKHTSDKAMQMQMAKMSGANAAGLATYLGTQEKEEE